MLTQHREQEFENLLEEQAQSEAKKDEEIDGLKRRIDDERVCILAYNCIGTVGQLADFLYIFLHCLRLH